MVDWKNRCEHCLKQFEFEAQLESHKSQVCSQHPCKLAKKMKPQEQAVTPHDKTPEEIAERIATTYHEVGQLDTLHLAWLKRDITLVVVEERRNKASREYKRGFLEGQRIVAQALEAVNNSLWPGALPKGGSK